VSDKAKFSIGQIVAHKLFDYRGVVFEVDPQFMLSDEWYDQMAKTKPPKDKPWYSVMVHNASHTTYVAQQNLASTDNLESINHPDLNYIFESFIDGKYQLFKKRFN
jgi:heat shock protein HspQ